MAAPSSPILIYDPDGGVPVTVPRPPIEDAITGSSVVQLVEGQAYIDVTFGTIQMDDEWVFVELTVVNTTDPDPLNIWPGILTGKTPHGFQLQLNGMPDSDNYYLHWAISGTDIAASPATTYALSGPASGDISVASTPFTVALLPSTTVAVPVTVTPDDGGAGGTFTPTSIMLTTGAPSGVFTYTPASYGAKTISVTNDGGLTNPASLTYTVNPLAATAYTMLGPSTGTVGVASTNFTVALSPVGGAVTGTVTVTPSDGGGGGTFTPTTVGLTTGAPSATFTYTPASSGAKTISATNDGGLTNPASLTYTASAGGIADGDPVSTWADSSGNGHTATQTGALRPIYKTAIVNGKPVVRMVPGAGTIMNLATTVPGDIWTMFVVMKPGAARVYSLLGDASFTPQGPNVDASTLGMIDRKVSTPFTNTWGIGWHIFTARAVSDGSDLQAWLDGNALTTGGGSASVNTGNFSTITGGEGDLAEVIHYNRALTTGERDNIRQYLAAKYAISVAGGGTAADPSTVANLAGWWKADSL